MDKRVARILLGCTAGTVIVILLFLMATHLTHPTCELIVIEQTQYKSSALANFPKEKPIKSHDKTTLIKISAYLEYNLHKEGSSKSSQNAASSETHTSSAPGQDNSSQPAVSQLHPLPQQSVNSPPATGQQAQQQAPNQAAQVPAQASSQQAPPALGKGPTPSTPQSAFTSQQLANSSLPFANQTTSGSGSGSSSSESKSEKPRFLPLELEDVEIKKVDDNKYTYTLNFNCSTMKLYLVKKSDRVYVDRISLELDLKSQKKSNCELKLPNNEIFVTEVPLDGWARYYCDKPLKYSCYYNISNSKNPEILLADLHINAIEFETPGFQPQQPSGSGGNKLLHKKHDFLGTRRTCSV